jgi:putative tryptophan/tyrosine transport system substrate-binding protein
MQSHRLGRRDLVALLGGAAALPLAARAQQPKLPVIGVLYAGKANEVADKLAAFRRTLNEAGCIEGRDFAFEYRYAEGNYDKLSGLAAELARSRVTMIVTLGGSPPLLAARAATTTIPIIFQTGNDPVAQGLVASLNRPGGNLTGITTLAVEVAPKRLEVLHELLPNVSTVVLLYNPLNPGNERELTALQAAARAMSLQLHVVNAAAERDFDKSFASLSQLQAEALAIVTDALFVNNASLLGALSARYLIPAIFQQRDFVASGGLLSYGSDAIDSYRLVATYVVRVLKGEKPADLPVQRATKVELIVNLKTAKALGVSVPTSILVRADEVIE